MKHHPDNWRGYVKSAQDLCFLKQFDKAQEVIKKGLERFPNQLNLLTNANAVYRDSGDRKESLIYANLLMKHHPDNWNGYVRGAQDLCSLKQFDKAQEVINLGIKNLKEKW